MKLTFAQAYEKASIGQIIKPIGNEFHSNAAYYIKTKVGLEWTIGGVGGEIDQKTLNLYLETPLDIEYGIYNTTDEYSRVYI